LRASGPVADPAASGAAATPGRARVSRAAPHTSPNDPGIEPSLPLCPKPGAMDGQGARSGEDRGTRSLPVLRASGPVAYPAASGAAAGFGRDPERLRELIF
jgi:hypothetical protein